MTYEPPPPSGGRAAARPRRVIRLVDGLAGVVAAGMLTVGLLLLVAALFAPALLSRFGLGPAAGPGWGAVAAHLLVGAGGEVVVRRRPRWESPARFVADLSVLAASVMVIWLTWWR